jgi:group I intron endonuclease
MEKSIMAVGIYKLNFTGTNKCYIGQSVNITKRFNEHINSMRKGIAKHKLQEAFSKYGLPTLEIIVDDLSEEELDSTEFEAIQIYDAVNNGFNTLEFPGNPDIRGHKSIHAKLDKNQYIEIFRLLADTDMQIVDIADAMDTTKDIVGGIFIGKSHFWLYEEYPEYATKILKKRTIGRYYTKTSLEDRVLISPSNKVYELSNIREFCREHDLQPAHISAVLIGKRKSHKGWKKFTAQTVVKE